MSTVDGLAPIKVDMGSHQVLTVDKVFGPSVFSLLRVWCDTANCEWVVETCQDGSAWVESARIPADVEVW